MSDPAGLSTPTSTSLISGLDASLPVAERTFQPLSVVEKVTVSPEPDAYLN